MTGETARGRLTEDGLTTAKGVRRRLGAGPPTLLPGIAAPETRIGRGGQPWCRSSPQVRKAITSSMSWADSFRFGNQTPISLLVVELGGSAGRRVGTPPPLLSVLVRSGA